MIKAEECDNCGLPMSPLTAVEIDTVDGLMSMCPECAVEFLGAEGEAQ